MPEQSLPSRRATSPGPFDPFSPIRREFDRMLEDFRGFAEPRSFAATTRAPWPSLEVREDDAGYRVKVDLAGMKREDVQVEVRDKTLLLSGERRDEREEKDAGRVYSERSYGRFERTIPLDQAVAADKVEAVFRDGVLDIVLPKAEPTPGGRRIDIKPG